MSITGQAASLADQIDELSVTHKEEVVTSGKNSGSSIETSENDESDQILYMIQNLPARQKRRTLLQLQPLMSSTVIETDTTAQRLPKKDDSSATQNTSTIVVKSSGNPVSPKLRVFSGSTPTPSGHVSFQTWHKAARRLCTNTELSDEEKIALIHNSLCQPALDLVQSALDSGSPTSVLRMLEKAYGSVDDPRDLLNAFNATTMDRKEQPSEYLNRLHLKLEELKDREIIPETECSEVLLRQFNYGCLDEHIALKLRLDEKEDDPPEYGDLLFALRKEEAKRIKKTLVHKSATTLAVTPKQNQAVEKLRKEVEELTAKLAPSKPNPLQDEKAEHEKAAKKPSSKGGRSVGVRKKLRFCFKCGEDGHVVWRCRNPQNTDLVCKKFEDARMEQEN